MTCFVVLVKLTTFFGLFRPSSGHKVYRVSKKSFSDYKHLLQENYVEYKHIFLPLLNP